MKSFVLEKTKYILTNSWFGLILPATVHQLLNISDKSSSRASSKSFNGYTAHPAESRISRQMPSKAKP